MNRTDKNNCCRFKKRSALSSIFPFIICHRIQERAINSGRSCLNGSEIRKNTQPQTLRQKENKMGSNGSARVLIIKRDHPKESPEEHPGCRNRKTRLLNEHAYDQRIIRQYDILCPGSKQCGSSIINGYFYSHTLSAACRPERFCPIRKTDCDYPDRPACPAGRDEQ